MRWRWVSVTALCSLGYPAEFCAKNGRQRAEREGGKVNEKFRGSGTGPIFERNRCYRLRITDNRLITTDNKSTLLWKVHTQIVYASLLLLSLVSSDSINARLLVIQLFVANRAFCVVYFLNILHSAEFLCYAFVIIVHVKLQTTFHYVDVIFNVML